MITYLDHRVGHYLLLFGISILMFFVNLGGFRLWEVDEGRNATCALEMLASGNWTVPTFNGELRVDKPPLLYWFQMGAYQAFGIDEFAARFPSAVAALLTVLLCYELARSMFTALTGLLAGLIVATTPMLIGAGRFANPDALLNCFSLLSLVMFWRGWATPRWSWFAAQGLAVGLALLAKGPVGMIMPFAIAQLFLAWNRQWRTMFDRRWFVAILAGAVLVLPWYLRVGVETKGQFWRGFFLKHHYERFISVMDEHAGFPGYYLVVLIVLTAPWSLYLGLSWWFGLWSTICSPVERMRTWWTTAADADVHAPAYRLLALWIFVYVAAFSVAVTKLPNYVMPALVPCAILIARFLERWQSGEVKLPVWVERTQMVTLIVGGLALGIGLLIGGGVGEWSPRSFPGLERWAILGAVPIGMGVVGWRLLDQRRRFMVVFTCGAVLLFAPFAGFGFTLFDQCKAAHPLVEQAGALRPDDDIRVGIWSSHHLASLSFYTQRQVEDLKTENDVAEFFQARVPVYVVMPIGDWERMHAARRPNAHVVGRHYDLYQHTDLVVLTNR